MTGVRFPLPAPIRDIKMCEIDYTTWEYPEHDLTVLEEFNGYVFDIDDKRKTFWVDCENSYNELSTIEISISKLPVEERPYLSKGTYFRWRFYEDPDYEDVTLSEFVFYKRTWSKEELEEADRKAKELAESLKFN